MQPLYTTAAPNARGAPKEARAEPAHGRGRIWAMLGFAFYRMEIREVT